MNKIYIKKIDVNNKTVKCQYIIDGEWKRYFEENSIPEIEYSIAVEEVPKSVLVVPFICNILPIAWLCNATIYVDYLDKNFYDKVEDIKAGYRNMYPFLEFSGEIKVGHIKDIVKRENKKKSGVFFSGGVDAFTTLFRHIEDSPVLMTIWGADVKLCDKSGWYSVKSHVKKIADNFGLDYILIRSNFRTVIVERELDKLVRVAKDGWWHAFQHGIAIIAHAAPIAYIYGLENVYIASSFPESMKGKYTCASDPIIDNQVHFCNCKTIHDGYELDRQRKIRFIISKVAELKTKIELRVCWEASGGKNCCHCEKCYRTILEIISEGGNPNDYGFPWNDSDIERCKRDMKFKITSPQFFVDQFYPAIQEAFEKNRNIIKNIDKYNWVLKMNFDKFNAMPIKKLRYCFFIRNTQVLLQKIYKKICVSIMKKDEENIEW